MKVYGRNVKGQKTWKQIFMGCSNTYSQLLNIDDDLVGIQHSIYQILFDWF
jgi:hypothetical protein